MNKHQSSTELLIMYHCLIFCKLTFDLHRNTRLHILNKKLLENYISKVL